ncbi:hypothetical protein CVT91_08190 [Candidatus Atribacteria bacterium HGW-Atribacteria-1]|nr:MAG: hypothetical protein CVT91_08190 [Candidatus Atribacteria bacterium HGW-Atribacteria-1]
MPEIEFLQSRCKSLLKIIGEIPTIDLSINAGKAWENSYSIKARDDSIDFDIVQKLNENNIFFEPDKISLICESLIKLSLKLKKYKLNFSAYVNHQSEFIKVIAREKIVEDYRKWSNGRIVIITENRRIYYKEILITPNIKDTVKRFDAALNLILKEIKELNIDSTKLPPSLTTVIFAPGVAGYFVHEVFGHMLEGDFVTKGLSIFGKSIKLNDLIGPEFLNVIDDPTGCSEYIGLSKIDDEGELLKRIELISEGRLKGFLCNRESAEILGNKDFTGCARRQSYKYKAIPRMRATYIPDNKNGLELSNLVENTERGVLVSQLARGQANPLTGDFTLVCGRSHLIENGKIGAPLHDAIISGSVITTLQNIESIGNDFEMLPLQCGKAGQIIPVCAGSPSIKVNKMMIRGMNDGN